VLYAVWEPVSALDSVPWLHAGGHLTILPMALRPFMVGYAFFSTPWYVSQLNLALFGPLPDFAASAGHLQQLQTTTVC